MTSSLVLGLVVKRQSLTKAFVVKWCPEGRQQTFLLPQLEQGSIKWIRLSLL